MVKMQAIVHLALLHESEVLRCFLPIAWQALLVGGQRQVISVKSPEAREETVWNICTPNDCCTDQASHEIVGPREDVMADVL
jgi:hypothetical protein